MKNKIEVPPPAYLKFASVVLDLSIDSFLDYGIPSEMLALVRPGVRVEVPVRGKKQPGFIYEVKDSTACKSVRPIERILPEAEFIQEDLFNLALWMARYYCADLRRVFKLLLPGIIRKQKGHKEQQVVMRGKPKEVLREFCIEFRNKYPAQGSVLDVMLQAKKGMLLTELLEKTKGSRSPIDSLVKKGLLILDIVRIDRSPLVDQEYFHSKPKVLNSDQSMALSNVVKSLEGNFFQTHLLYGVTGSGKTEVYLQAIEKAMQQGKGTIMLVPEISLTTQTIERFRSRFEGHIAILHHRLSEGERYDEWHKIKRGDALIVIGARSAIFSPVKNLGLIIIDEEHEQSYKHSDGQPPCYQARDVAVMRGKLCNAAVVLGSATPSLESYYNASCGKYVLSVLKDRAASATLPTVHIVDMKKEFERNQGYTNFSAMLINGIKERQERGEQSILFLNRRGYHTSLLCQDCGVAVRCAHCDVALTFHQNQNAVSCHLCNFCMSPPPLNCPGCKSSRSMKFRGAGTELIEKTLHAIFKDIRTLRIDADTTKHKGSQQKLLKAFGSGKADVLIGTQMIAKGLHFPGVTLVGVINGDSSLNIPDFRSSETAFQLITQVAGRSGRGDISGEVIIQTLIPENQTIQLASRQDYEGFAKEELEVRKFFGYPPFRQMAKVSFSGEDQKITMQVAEQAQRLVKGLLPAGYEAFPVAVSGYGKVKDRYCFQFLIKGDQIYLISTALSKIRGGLFLPKDVRMCIDINPSTTFF